MSFLRAYLIASISEIFDSIKVLCLPEIPNDLFDRREFCKLEFQMTVSTFRIPRNPLFGMLLRHCHSRNPLEGTEF